MKNINLNNYIETIALIKQNSTKIITNCFMTMDKIRTLTTDRNCVLIKNETFVFLAVPEHELFYRLYFYTVDNGHLPEGLNKVKNKIPINTPLVCSITGATEYAQNFEPFFREGGFTLRRRMRRFIYIKSEKNDFSGYKGKNNASFAETSDAEEIYAMLIKYFDVYTQAVPEPAMIKENAAMEQISVIKKDGGIAALLYYELHGSSLYNIFEVVAEPYRGEMYNIELMAHRDEQIKIKGRNIKLQYGWRDMDDERLIRLGEFNAKRWGTRPGETVIYTFYRE